MDACFTAFDKDGDGFLSLAEFELICRALFRNDRGKVYELEEQQLKEIFAVFDINGDCLLDRIEFEVYIYTCILALKFIFLNVVFFVIKIQEKK